MKSEEFLNYCATHAETPRCGFTPEQLARLADLAGRTVIAHEWRNTRHGVYGKDRQVITNTVAAARDNRLNWPELQGEIGYLNLMREIADKGTVKTDRTGVGTKSLFGKQLRFDLSAGFPLLTTKRVFWKGVLHELLWILRGDTNIKYLEDHGVSIWREWANENGDLGPVYGKQWRYWENWIVPENGDAPADSLTHQYIDQIANLMKTLRTQPDSRRMVVSAWNPADLGKVALAWCHAMFQVNMRPMSHEDRVKWAYRTGKINVHGCVNAAWLETITAPRYFLDLSMYQRSDNERLH